MSGEIVRPPRLQINAWAEGVSNSDTLSAKTLWAQAKLGEKQRKFLAAPAPADPRDWRHPEVGWGLVLRDDPDLSHTARCSGEDAPPALRKLLEARPGSPVLRWSAADNQQNYLRRYYADGSAQDLSIAAPKPGIGPGRIPRYLLLYGSPEVIPWAVQYALNMSTFVGRIDLEGVELENYVNALVNDWSGHVSHSRAPLIWTVDHGQPDITWLMARAIGMPLWKLFEGDSDLTGRTLLKDAEATRESLCSALKETRPGLIITTSHGMTGPLTDKTALQAQLGVPVDRHHQPLDLAGLTDWQAGGAIWYAQACCSAGSDSATRYGDLMGPDSSVGKILAGVADNAGAMVAPLPKMLLGSTSPLKAFVGHVEPTFDWTLRDPATNQPLNHVLTSALYNNLYQADRPTPIGFALRGVFDEAGAFYGAWQDAIDGINNNVAGMRDMALYRQLVARDRQTLVVLGDPTVSLASL